MTGATPSQKIIIVTGASSGLGRMAVEQLVEMPAFFHRIGLESLLTARGSLLC